MRFLKTLCAGITARAHSELHKTLALPPLVLVQEHGSQLGKRIATGILERPEDALAIVDGQRDNSRIETERPLEDAPRGLFDEIGELPNVVVRNRDAGELHGGGFINAAGSASEERPSDPDAGPDDQRRCPPPRKLHRPLRYPGAIGGQT